nr:hypothetical protein [Gammaproteobacteria bacterium]
MEIAREEPHANVVRAWERGRLRIGTTWYEGHVIVSADRVITGWEVSSPLEIGRSTLEPAVALAPEIILLGTGPDVILPNVELMAELAAESIGLEIMTTPAACRTFNLLLNERRRVVAALFNPA